VQRRSALTAQVRESSDQEMCFFLLFYYPYDHIDGCVIGS
jgi:hypothetical protein